MYFDSELQKLFVEILKPQKHIIHYFNVIQ